MRISVIVPTYKPGDYLWECLDSLVAQTFPKEEFEVVLVLNGCTEPYKSAIEKYIVEKMQDMNVIFIHTDVGGVSNARNKGLDNARGEYISFIDDDDIISNNYLSELYRVSSRYYVGLSNIFSFHDNLEERGEEFYVSNFIKDKKRIEDSTSFAYRNYISFPVAKLYHREIIGERRFDKRFTNGEDGLFSRLISDGYKGLKCTKEDAIYFVRFRQGSASRSKLQKIKIFKDTIMICWTLVRYYVKNPRGYSFKLYLISFLSFFKNAYMLLKNK